jgi:DNA helicase II / ATP-dependent DNA helicase PcrA
MQLLGFVQLKREARMPPNNQISSDTLLDDIEHHFRVFAGPGAGKTYWLLKHIKNVLAKSKRLSSTTCIACISYTNVAVQQINDGLDNSGDSVEVSTIHSFLYKNIVKPYLHLLKNIDESDLVNYSLVDGHDEHRPTYGKFQEWINSIGKRNLLRLYSQFLPALRSLHWKLDEDTGELSIGTRRWVKFFPSTDLDSYKQIFWKEGIIDHEDVLYFAFRILTENPALRIFLSAKYPYLFLDEFQDTNPIQTKIVKWLSDEGTIIGVIGDSKQSIYAFQGAKPEDFVNFSLPDRMDYVIPDNRRSTHRIIDFINQVRNDEITQKGLRDETGENVKLLIGEISSVVTHVQENFHDKSEIVVLTRKNALAAVIRNLERGGGANPWDEFYTADENRAKFFEQLVGAGELARNKKLDFAIKTIITGIRVRKTHIQKPFKYDSLITDIARRGMAVFLLELVMNNYEALCSKKVIEVYDFISSKLEELRNGLALTGCRAGKFKTFAEETTYKELAQSVRIGDETRNIRTIHQAKGAEFENILMHLEQESDIEKIWGNDTEEKRILYVACSRARDSLILTVPELSTTNGDRLKHMGLELIDV